MTEAPERPPGEPAPEGEADDLEAEREAQSEDPTSPQRGFDDVEDHLDEHERDR
jgi:hypothetical protein